MGKSSSKTFPLSTRSNTSFLKVQLDIQQMSNIQSRLAIKSEIIQSLSVCKSYPINLLNSSNHLWDTSDFWVSWSKSFSTIFEHTYAIIIQWTFSFPEFVSTCQKSVHFINSCSEYECFLSQCFKTQKQLQYFFLNILQKCY